MQNPEKFKKVFVGNLNFSTNWQKLKDYMKKAGNVLFADVFLDQKGRSKGCGYVKGLRELIIGFVQIKFG